MFSQIIKTTSRAVVFLLAFMFLATGLFLAWLFYTSSGARVAVHLISAFSLGSHKVSWAGLDGSLAKGVRVAHLEVRDIPRFPSGNFLRIQSGYFRLRSLMPDGFEMNIEHARLFPHGEDSIVLDARVRGMTFTAQAYTNSLNLADVWDILIKFFHVPPMTGVLRDIDLAAGGTFDRPWVKAAFIVERISSSEFSVEECPVRAGFRFMRVPSHWETYGRLDLAGGWLQSPGVRIDILESRLSFSGQVDNPGLDIQATSRVARTRIDITVKGTRNDPKLFLSSDEPYSKEQLLLMVATGRRWSGMEASSPDQMAPQLASSFVDYLLFGGSRKKVIEWFGLSDVSLIADEKSQGVALSKDVTERLGLGYGVMVQANETDRTREVTQILESDFRLTGHLTVTAQKELKASRTEPGSAPQEEEETPDDRVFLKYRSRF